MNKKKIAIIISIVLIVLFGLILFLLLNKSDDKKNIIKKDKLPYVEEKEIEVIPVNELKINVKPYARDINKNPVDLEGISFEDTKGTYNFRDLTISEEDEDGYVIYSFKYDLVVPIKYTVDRSINNPSWSRSYALVYANLFDYYTGEVYRVKNESTNGNIIFRDTKVVEEDMGYTDITWDGKTYKIGVRTETSAKWDGVKLVDSKDKIDTYTDTNRATIVSYIYAPKDYDGLMIALNKNDSTKQLVLDQIEFNNHYSELLNEAEKNGEKSKELIEIEESLNNTSKLLDTKFGKEKTNTKDDFYVIRVNDIKKASE